MSSFIAKLADLQFRGTYLVFCFALMVLPILALSFWYHTRIKRTAGGAELMRRQNKSNVTRGNITRAGQQMSDGVSIARDIERGVYGSQPRKMQHTVYWITGLWLSANILAFGILIYADEVNRPIHEAREAARQAAEARVEQDAAEPAAPANENPATSE